MAVARTPDGSPSFPGRYDAYVDAIGAEAAVVAGLPDAPDRLERTMPVADENDFAAALLTRAAGRLHSDVAELQRAVTLWEAIGARFERACTLLLVPSRADEGRRELAALGCTEPAPTR